MSATRPLSGVLLVAKPPAMTSHDVVDRVRRSAASPDAKTGHAGTLDPFATGLLLVLVGRATRAQRFLVELPKRYHATARLGARSDTGDCDGDITATGARTDEAALRAALEGFRGEIEQRVPAHSAVKVAGERLYRSARRGEEVERPVRRVQVSELELTAFDADTQRGELELACSKGTYVRQVVADLGDAVGAGAYCEALERTAVGPFELDRAASLEQVDQVATLPQLEAFLPLDAALAFLPERALSPADAEAAGHGRSLPDGQHGGPVRLTAGARVVAIAEPRKGRLRPVVVFPQEPA